MAKTIWSIDPGHSKIQFKVKHLAIANVVGTFNVFSGSIASENSTFDEAEVGFELNTESIDTNNVERDSHLKSNLFFDASKYPKITFKGSLLKTGDAYQLTGDLTILETTKMITLDVEYTGTGEGRFNDIRAGFELSGKINRRDFGLNFNLMTDVGSLVVGEEIRLQGDIELIRQ
jgi:polyisoprenoid-binding protein YceI